MSNKPPIQVLCSDDIQMYETEIYLQVKYPIENIFEAIEKGYLSKSTISNGDNHLDIYYIGDEGYNIFIRDPYVISENMGLDKQEAIEFIKQFLFIK